MNNKFYITTAIPYVNAKPHVGHALEFVQADVIARYHKLLNEDVILLSGSDENALKNVRAAENSGQDVQNFVDTNSKLFENLAEKLNVRFDRFQKGSNADHFESSQKLWNLCAQNGDIYKKEYTGFYCVGCELFYEPDELNENGECYEHPGKPLEKVSETNYFFKLSRYQDEIKKLIENDQLKITPESRKNEMLSFLDQGLKDISISRSNERAKNWGVPVPDDDTQRMYVWFDALNIYRSGLGDQYDKFWPADVHVIGKGITRFHAIYWPAFLLSAGLPLPKSLFVHGYFTVDGQKMSKTLGNVIDPEELIEQFGTDALRYYFLSQIPPTSDGDFSVEKLKHVYNSDLANGLGNLVSRVAKLAEGLSFPPNNSLRFITEIHTTSGTMPTLYAQAFEKFRFDDVLKLLWGDLGVIEKYIDYDDEIKEKNIKYTDQNFNNKQPWNVTGEERTKILRVAVDAIRYLGIQLQPLLPETAEKILKQFSGEIKSSEPLFPRI